jgi:TM2 domain-containing membrane protein YozV
VATYPVISLPTVYAANMTEQQRAVYYAQLAVVQKDEVLGVVLAVFLGTFGAHHFYMRRIGLGILYCFLSVTGFSTIAGFIEAFFMPERVRRYNANQAAAIANHLGLYNYGAPANVGTQGGTIPPPAAPGSSTPAYSQVSGSTPAVDTDLTTPAICPSCNAPNPTGVNFCSVCGSPIHP